MGWRGVALAWVFLAAAACGGQPSLGSLQGHREETGASFRAGRVEAPAGFAVEVLATGLDSPAALAMGPDGRLYVAEAFRGRVVALGYPRPGAARAVAGGLLQPVGLLFVGGDLYVSEYGRLLRLRDPNGDGRYEVLEVVTPDIPVGLHQNNQPALGPDGMLYLPVGSTCGACQEASPLSATVLRIDPQSGAAKVYATGLRNVYEMAFHPLDGSLWAADNARDDLGDLAPEELNLVREGSDYGWPSCWGVSGGEAGADCSGKTPALLEMEPHTAPSGLAFYTGDAFPARYRGGLFLAMYGSVAGDRGRKVVWVGLERAPEAPGGWLARGVEGFLAGLGRPVDVLVAPDGALLVADMGEGAVYRVTWVGP